MFDPFRFRTAADRIKTGGFTMEKYTQKQLRNLVATGAALDITNSATRAIPENYRQVGYSSGVYGCNGMLLKGLETGRLYAITDRTTAIYLY